MKIHQGLAAFCLGTILLNSVSTGILLGATVVLVKDFVRMFLEKNKDFFISTCNFGLVAFVVGAIFFNFPAGILWGASGILFRDCLRDLNWLKANFYYSKLVLTEQESKLKYWNHLGEEGSIQKEPETKTVPVADNGTVLVNFTSKTGHHYERVAFSAILDQNYALKMVKGNS